VIVVDTSAWVDLLRDNDTPARRRLDQLLRADPAEAVVTEVVVAEVLSGARSEQHRRALRARLLHHEVLSLGGLAGFEAAADLYRTARAQGVTVRFLTDCLVAVPAIRAGATLLHADRDFDHLARISELCIEPLS
jgi:predicted nucleic acid-binding protein